MLTLPGLIDPHVHLREPGQTHKEDWDSGTSAALAGGVTLLLAMPNTIPPIVDAKTLSLALGPARSKARCDFAQFLGAGEENIHWEKDSSLPQQSAGLKMYLDGTFGTLRLDTMTSWQEHFKRWPKTLPIVAHAENRSMAAIILMAAMHDRPVHIAHVSLQEEILLIKAAKEKGIQVTCEVCPHHLFLTKDDIPGIAPDSTGRREVRPRLGSKEDVAALWANMKVIDCFATDHAPHTLEEKDSPAPPPGFPGLETILPLFLEAIQEGRLTRDDLLERMVTNSRRIFSLPEQSETWIEVDEKVRYEIRGSEMHSRCGWTPFEGWQVHGRIRKVVLRGKPAFDDGKILAEPGYGRNVRLGY